MSKPFSFLAYLPPIQTAITVSGDGDLMQAKFNVNVSGSPDALKLLMMTGKKLKITIEEVKDIAEKEVKKADGKRQTRNPLYNKAD